MINKKEIVEKVEELLEEQDINNQFLMEQFFNLLFWKDYKEGHVHPKDKDNIFLEITKATRETNYDGEKSYRLDTKEILPFINKIRKQIGLKELTEELGCLMEMTTEVKKEIMMKRLEDK